MVVVFCYCSVYVNAAIDIGIVLFIVIVAYVHTAFDINIDDVYCLCCY